MENPTCREESLGLNSDGHTDWVTGRQVRMRARGAETICCHGRGGRPGGGLHCCVFWGTRAAGAVPVTYAGAPGSEPLPAGVGTAGAHFAALMPRPALWTQGAGP